MFIANILFCISRFPPMGVPPAQPGPPPMVDLQPPPVAAPPPQVMPSAAPPDEPPAKRPRGEDHLIPEDQFLAQWGGMGPVTFQVVCPTSSAAGGASDWRLTGQTCTLQLPLTDTVSVIKAR